jgi:hypothetical protein
MWPKACKVKGDPDEEVSQGSESQWRSKRESQWGSQGGSQWGSQEVWPTQHSVVYDKDEYFGNKGCAETMLDEDTAESGKDQDEELWGAVWAHEEPQCGEWKPNDQWADQETQQGEWEPKPTSDHENWADQETQQGEWGPKPTSDHENWADEETQQGGGSEHEPTSDHDQWADQGEQGGAWEGWWGTDEEPHKAATHEPLDDGWGANVHSPYATPSDLASAAEAKTQKGKGVDSTDEAVDAKAGGTVQAADAEDERKEKQSGSEQVGTDEATAVDERKENEEGSKDNEATAADERKQNEEGPAGNEATAADERKENEEGSTGNEATAVDERKENEEGSKDNEATAADERKENEEGSTGNEDTAADERTENEEGSKDNQATAADKRKAEEEPHKAATDEPLEDGWGANVHSPYATPSDLASAAEGETQKGKGVDSTDEAIDAKNNTIAEGSNVEKEGDGGNPGSASDYERFGDEVAARSMLKKPCEVSKNSDDPKALEEAGIELPPAKSLKHTRQAKGQVLGDPNRWKGDEWGVKRGSLGLVTPPAKVHRTASWNHGEQTSDH